MKNLHVLPTDKPSRLWLDNGVYYLHQIPTTLFRMQNIYITSDEEIKEGDWYISILENEVYKATKETQNIMSVANLVGSTSYKNTHFKIILTTDQDLIKDSVQVIDDEFLEWFVKNPSCEEVEVKDIRTIPALQLGSPNGHLMYKIIIPKEHSKEYTNGYVLATSAINNGGDPQELLIQSRSSLTFDDFDKGWKNACKEFIPKQEPKSIKDKIEDFVEKCREDHLGRLLSEEEPKQETLEDRVKRLSEGHNLQTTLIAFANVGAEWQQERMYSEEEVYEISKKSYLLGQEYKMVGIFNNWFEQFKKK